MRKKSRIFSTLLLLIVLIPVLIIYVCNVVIVNSAKGSLYSDPQTIPYNRVGLLLGTAKYEGGGFDNPYYDYRIEATVKLIKDHKIRYLIISGDNSRKEYNEPASMRRDLIKAGIDSSIIYLDFAGFRTFDSIVRANEIFGQDSVTIISQKFHNERAIYIASKTGVTAIGFNAADLTIEQGWLIQLREKLARVKVFLDFYTGKQPKFLGKKIKIPA